MEDKAATEQTDNSKQLANDSLKAITTKPKDSLNMKPVVFDDAELGTVLMQMVDFYHVKVGKVDEQLCLTYVFLCKDFTLPAYTAAPLPNVPFLVCLLVRRGQVLCVPYNRCRR